MFLNKFIKLFKKEINFFNSIVLINKMNSPLYKNSNNSLNEFSNGKSKKINQLIIDSINIFNIKYNVLSTDLLNLKNEFIKQMNTIQNLLNNNDLNLKTIEIKDKNKNENTSNVKKIDFQLEKNTDFKKIRFFSPPVFESKIKQNLEKKLSELKKINPQKVDEKKNNENKKLKGIIRKQRSMILKTFKNTLNDNNQFFDRSNKRIKTVSFRKDQNSLSINEKGSNSEIIKKYNKLDSKYKALIILSNNLLIPDEEKLKLKYLDKKLYNRIETPYIFNESILKLKEEFDNPNNSISDDLSFQDKDNKDNLVELHKSTFPSKTSQSGINFITKKKEELIYSDSSDLGKELCNLLYIILNNEDKFDNTKSLKELFKYLFDDFKISSVKELFFKILYPKIYIDNDIDKELYNIFSKRILKNLSEIKLICKTRNAPLSWIAINILEFDKYFEMIFKSKLFD